MDEIAIIDLECDWNGFLLDLAGLIPAHRHTGLCQDIHKAQVSKRLKRPRSSYPESEPKAILGYSSNSLVPLKIFEAI